MLRAPALRLLTSPDPQAKAPFSDDSRAFIAGLSADRDLALLRERSIPLRPACARTFRATTLVLQRVAARGLSPYDVAVVMQRHAEEPSPLEVMHACGSGTRDSRTLALCLLEHARTRSFAAWCCACVRSCSLPPFVPSHPSFSSPLVAAGRHASARAARRLRMPP